MGEHLLYCGAMNPGSTRGGPCIRARNHEIALHRDMYGTEWEITSHQPDRAAQVEEIHRLNALDAQLSDAGFTREELTEAAAKQARPAPTKAEILAAIRNTTFCTTSDHCDAVEKLFKERGL